MEPRSRDGTIARDRFFPLLRIFGLGRAGHPIRRLRQA